MTFKNTGILSPFKEPSIDGVPSSPLLITPVRQKKYDMYQSTIQNIWKQAKIAMNSADRIVFIGYSFPPTDTVPMELIRKTLELRQQSLSVEFVSPSAEDIASRIGDSFLSKAGDVKIHPMRFEDFLDLQWKEIPIVIKKAALKHPELKEWLTRLALIGQASHEIYK